MLTGTMKQDEPDNFSVNLAFLLSVKCHRTCKNVTLESTKDLDCNSCLNKTSLYSALVSLCDSNSRVTLSLQILSFHIRLHPLGLK